MENFKEWLQQQDEGMGRNLLAYGLMGLGGLGAYNYFHKDTMPASSVVIQGDQVVSIGYANNDKFGVKKAIRDAQKKILKKLGVNSATFYGGEIIDKKVEGEMIVIKYRCFIKQPEYLKDMGN